MRIWNVVFDIGGVLADFRIKEFLAGKGFDAVMTKRILKAAGQRVYYLSNYSRKAYDECGESLSFMPHMDGGIVSFQVGMTKPDPRMFRLFLDRYYPARAGARGAPFRAAHPGGVTGPTRSRGFRGHDPESIYKKAHP